MSFWGYKFNLAGWELVALVVLSICGTTDGNFGGIKLPLGTTRLLELVA